MSKIIFQKKLLKGNFTIYNSMPDLKNIVQINQIHSSDIIVYENKDLAQLKADGILIKDENIKENHFAIKTADCIPAVFIGRSGVAIIHAGWVGVRDKILINPLLEKIEPYYCFLGPSISLESFEVQKEFHQEFPESDNFHLIKNKIYFDLQNEAKDQILNNFQDIQVEQSIECTFKNEQYNSYRRNKTDKRNWNIFSI